LLDSIYQLGRVQKDDDISSLLSSTSAKHVICLIFEKKKRSMKYKKIELNEVKKENEVWYLYKRDTSNKAPGLFLTGQISFKDIKKIRNILQKDPKGINRSEIVDFTARRIFSFANGLLINDKTLFDTLSDDRGKEIKGIVKKFNSETDRIKISRGVLREIASHEPETILLTTMICESHDSQPKYVGQIKDYVEFFKKGVYRKKTFQKGLRLKKIVSSEETYEEYLVCSVCNKTALIGVFHESPLPFYFTDKPLFFPDADLKQTRKGFPLCDDCYLQIQKGVKFIGDNLSYRIPFKGSELNFWLVPHLDNKQRLISFKNQLGNKNLTLNLLKELCSTLKAISMHDLRQIKNIESFLSFSALFYSINGWMRVINYVQGIYPYQLRRLFEVKDIVEKKYPYRIISDKFEEETVFFVGFPLLIEFFKNIRPKRRKKGDETGKKGWQNQVIIILEKMFTGKQIPIEELIKNINIKTQSVALRSFDLMLASKTVLMGMMLLEYLISLNGTQINGLPLSEEGNHQDNQLTGDIKHIQKFIDSHNNILIDGNTRAIFATGICVGILLEVQNDRYKKIAPFWNRLNRLEIDAQRIKEFPCEVKSKLAMYNARKYDHIISYLQANEISKLDIILSNSTINREDLNLIFTIGLSFGYLLKNEIFKRG
jgi:CRISPR-associated protein Cas8b/Csh1 subtype I-B